MKIVHCLQHYLPEKIGGTEVYTHTLASLQKAAGNEVNILTPHFEYYLPGQFTHHYTYEGVDVYQYLETSDPNDKEVLSGKKNPDGILNFAEKLKLLNPDVIHFHELVRSIGLGVNHVKLARETGAKILITMHLSFYSCNTNVLVNNHKLCHGIILEDNCSVCSFKTLHNLPGIIASPITKAGMLFDRMNLLSLLPYSKVKTLFSMPANIKRVKRELLELGDNVDYIVVLNNWYKNILLKNGIKENKIVVIHQALATNKKTLAKSTEQIKLPVKIVFLGRITPQKGVHHLIEAINNFTADQVRLDIYGENGDTKYYNLCLKESKHNNAITWKGSIKREAVLDALVQYDILCLPSVFSEMAPLVIQEAFAAGIPVLASHVYGNAEEIEHGYNGLLFDFDSVKSLTENIKKLINDPSLIQKMSLNIKKPDTFETVNDQYLKLYYS